MCVWDILLLNKLVEQIFWLSFSVFYTSSGATMLPVGKRKGEVTWCIQLQCLVLHQQAQGYYYILYSSTTAGPVELMQGGVLCYSPGQRSYQEISMLPVALYTGCVLPVDRLWTGKHLQRRWSIHDDNACTCAVSEATCISNHTVTHRLRVQWWWWWWELHSHNFIIILPLSRTQSPVALSPASRLDWL